MKLTELAVWASRLVITTTCLLLVAFLIDHWAYLLSSTASLGSIGRWMFFLILWIVLPVVCIRGLVLHLRRHINPLFAAEQIELESPEIKNSVSNFWQLRDPTGDLHPSIQQAMATRANLDLTDQRIQDGVDTRGLAHWGYTGLAMLAITAVYFAFLPRPSMQTLHRILIPWDTVQRPSEILISDITPGNQEVIFGSSVQITATVDGITSSDQVHLFYQTANGSLSAQSIPMSTDIGSSAFSAILGGDLPGIQQDLQYWIQAGDLKQRMATSERFSITAIPAPNIRILSIQYDYPAYTLSPQMIASDQFNIDAIEGTQVTLMAETNQPMDSAMIRLYSQDQDDPHSMPMEMISPTTCQFQWTLALLENLSEPRYSHYELVFTNSQGNTNPDPIQHSITVQRDLAPAIEFIKPTASQIDAGPVSLPVNRRLQLQWKAHDLDYGLENMTFSILSPGQEEIMQTLFHDPQGAIGLQQHGVIFDPRALKIPPGSRVVVYGTATDNRRISTRPEPNVSRSRQLIIHVVEPDENGSESEDPTEPNSDPENEDPNQPNSENPQQGDTPAEPEGGQGDSGTDPEGMGGAGTEAGDATPSEGTGDGQQGKPTDDNEESNMDQSPNRSPDEGEPGDQTNPKPNGSDSPNEGDPAEPREGEQGDSNMNDMATGNPDEPNSSNDQGTGDAQNGTPTGEQGDPNNHSNRDPTQQSNRKPNEDLHDGDVFERALEHLQNQDPSQLNKLPRNQSGNNDDPTEGNNAFAENPASDNEPEQGNDQSGNSNTPSAPDQGQSSSDKPSTQQNNQPPETSGDNGNPDSSNNNPASANNADPSGDPQNEPAGGTGENGSANKTVGESELPEGGAGDNTNTQSETKNQLIPDPKSPDKNAGGSNGETTDNSNKTEQTVTGQNDPNSQLEPPSEPPPLTDQERADLQYTRKATDLVLDYLKDQQHDPNQKLLDDLGITAEQLREMVSRYEKLKKDNTPAGQRTLDDTLRSLGLQPQTNQDPRKVQVKPDNVSGVRNRGVVSGLPAQLREQYRSFRKGTNISDE